MVDYEEGARFSRAGKAAFRRWLERQPVRCTACGGTVQRMLDSNVLRRVSGTDLVVEWYHRDCRPTRPIGVDDGWSSYADWGD